MSGMKAGRRWLSLIAAAAGLLGAGVAAAQASVFTYAFTITGVGAFTNEFNASQTDPIIPSFSGTITFDPTRAYAYTTTGIALTSTNMAYADPLQFRSSGLGGAGSTIVVLTFGTYAPGPTLSAPGFDWTGQATLSGSSITVAESSGSNLMRDFPTAGHLYYGTQFTAVFAQVDTAVPEPGAVAVLAVGLAGLGLARRRRGGGAA